MKNTLRVLTGDWMTRRFEVFERDNFTCQYCGQHAPNIQLEVDHVLPVTEGGDNALENLVTACWSCNRGKNTLWATRQYEILPTKKGGLKREAGRKERVYDYVLANPGKNALDIETALNLPPQTAHVYLRRLNARDLTYKKESVWFANVISL